MRGWLASLGPLPPSFQASVALNRGPLGMHEPSPHPLAPRRLERSRRGVRPTRAGRRLYADAVVLLAAAERFGSAPPPCAAPWCF